LKRYEAGLNYPARKVAPTVMAATTVLATRLMNHWRRATRLSSASALGDVLESALDAGQLAVDLTAQDREFKLHFGADVGDATSDITPPSRWPGGAAAT